MTYTTIKPGDLAGFDLAAFIENGKYRMHGSGEVLDVPPDELELCGNTYTFEYLLIGCTKLCAESVTPETIAIAIAVAKQQYPNWDKDGAFCNLGYV